MGVIERRRSNRELHLKLLASVEPSLSGKVPLLSFCDTIDAKTILLLTVGDQYDLL
jgi:hypothetical protein